MSIGNHIKEHIILGVHEYVNDIRSFGAACDGVGLYDVTASNSPTCAISSATGSFTASDIGKPCVVMPHTDAHLHRFGTITAVASSTACTAVLNLSPGALTNAIFVYGSDDSSAIDLALAAASANSKPVLIPEGITCTKNKHIVPNGVTLMGVGNKPVGNWAKDYTYTTGTNLVMVGYSANDFIMLGDGGASSALGCILRDINIDSMSLASDTIDCDNRRSTMSFVTALRGRGHVLNGGPGMVVTNCNFIGHNEGGVIKLEGDSDFGYNKVSGAGDGLYGIRIPNGDDINISNNHIYKDGSTSYAGGCILVEVSGTSPQKFGGILIANNKFDVSYGPHVHILVTTSGNVLRGININGNIAQQNNNVPNATYPYIQITSDVGTEIRALAIVGNIGRGSWADGTQGGYTYFVEASAMAGNIYGSVVGMNVVDNCNTGLFNAFTPDHDSGNISIAGVGSVLVKSTTT